MLTVLPSKHTAHEFLSLRARDLTVAWAAGTQASAHSGDAQGQTTVAPGSRPDKHSNVSSSRVDV